MSMRDIKIPSSSSRGKKIILGFVLRNAYTVLNIVLAFFMMPFILRHLGDRMYGLWVLLGAFVGYMGFLDLGLSQAVSRFTSRAIGKNDPQELNEIVNTSFVIFVVLSALAAGVTALAMTFARYFVPDASDLFIVRILLLCIGSNLCVSFPVRAFGGVVGGNLQYRVSEGITISELVLRYGLIWIFFKLGFGIIALGVIVNVVAIATHIALIYFAFRVEPRLQFNLAYFKREQIRALFSLSAFAFVSRLAGLLIERTDAFVVTAFLGLASTAHYSIATVLMGYLGNFLYRTIELTGPVISQDDGRGDRAGITQKFFILTRLMLFAALFFTALACFYGQHFIARWVGGEYLDAYPVLIILAGVTLVSSVLLPASVVLFNTSHHKFLALISVIEAVANLLLSIILVRHIGMIGVALGTLIPIAFIRGVVQPIYISKCLDIRPIVLIQLMTQSMGIAFLALLPVYLFNIMWIDPSYLLLASAGVVHAVLYFPAVWLLGFTPDDRRYLLGFLQRRR